MVPDKEVTQFCAEISPEAEDQSKKGTEKKGLDLTLKCRKGREEEEINRAGPLLNSIVNQWSEVLAKQTERD